MNYKIELLISILKVFSPFFIILYSSLLITRLLKIYDFTEKLLIIAVLNCSQIILSINLLSINSKVKLLPIIIFHILTISVVIIISKVRNVSLKIDFKTIFQKIANFFKEIKLNKYIKFLIIICLLIIICTSFFKGIIVPPFNYDSMTYHLARAGFWMQNNNINHFTTTAEFQNINPYNGEVLLLWLMILTNSDNITFLVQFLSLLILSLALYKVLRLIGFNRAVSLITIFTFSTLDMVVLQSYSTQNDLVIACFMVVAFLFLFKVVKAKAVDFRYIVISSIALGLAIGTKGYSYLMVLGFIIFLFIYGKNSRIKFIKLSYLLISSILGVFLFAGYSLIQNYYSYGAIFASGEHIEIMSISNPNLKTFISNFIRHISSFYQLHNSRFDFIGNFLRNIVTNIHNRLGISISSSVTTYPDTYFYFSNIRLNFDESYYGPFYFFIILPSMIYSLVIFSISKIWRKGKIIKNTVNNSLFVYIIPILFFLGYTLIFKWQPYSGRLLIAMVSFSMVSFSLMLQLIYWINKKYLFQIVSFICVVGVIVLSFFPLFKEDYVNLTKFDYSIEYQQRRGSFIREGQNLLHANLEVPYNIGMILRSGDQVYLLFGEKYQNELYYLAERTWNKNKISDILDQHELDGIIVNKNAEVFYDGYVFYYEKISEVKILDIDAENFLDILTFKNCDLIPEGKGFAVQAHNEDPYIEFYLPNNITDNKLGVMNIKLNSHVNAVTQIYYGYKGKSYSEEYSETYNIYQGENELNIVISDLEGIAKIRIDPINIKQDVLIEGIELFRTNGDFKIDFEGDYILFYK